MLASGPSAVAGTLSIEQDVFNTNVLKIVHTLGYERIESSPQPAGKGEMAVKKSTQCDFAVSEITVIRNDSKKNLQNPELAVIKF